MIRITRPKRSADLIEYQIYINDIHRGEIWNGETMEFAVENGRHTIYATSGGGNSKELYVDVNDSIVELELSCVVSGLELLIFPLRAMLYNVSRRDEYLILKMKDPDKEDIV